MLHCKKPPSQTLTTEVKHLLGLLDPANHAGNSNTSVVTCSQKVESYEAWCGGVACAMQVRLKCCTSQNNQTAGANVRLTQSTKMQHTPAPNLQPLCRQKLLCESPDNEVQQGMGMTKRHSLGSQESKD